MQTPSWDVDFAVIGSGFGGSVSALRLAEKGYRVAILEQGSHHTPDNLPRTNRELGKWLWLPPLGWRGFFSIRLFRHMMVLHGNAVGGGSITYANTLLVPPDAVWRNGTWAGLQDWTQVMPQHFDTAGRMLGITPNPLLGPADQRLRALAEAAGCGASFYPTRVGVYFGEADAHAHPATAGGDPYFNGAGPARQPCIGCGGCMVGCRYRAKNSLDYNYLYFAQKNGARLLAETEVTDIVPLDADNPPNLASPGNAADGAAGYRLTLRGRDGSTRSLTARGLVLTASSLGTQQLLLRLKDEGRLPRLSDALGRHVYTNAESLIGLRYPGCREDFSKGIAIGSGIHLSEGAHIEATRYNAGSDSTALLSTLMRPQQAGRWPLLVWLAYVLRQFVRAPRTTWRAVRVKDFARETIILLCMQTVPIGLTMRWRRTWWSPWRKRLVTAGERIPARIEAATAFALEGARRTGGVPMTAVAEMLFNVPTTAHCLGGAVLGATPAQGVCDGCHRVYGYRNFYICDGSSVSANLGVNPSLTIAALTEHAMSHIPACAENDWQATGVPHEG